MKLRPPLARRYDVVGLNNADSDAESLWMSADPSEGARERSFELMEARDAALLLSRHRVVDAARARAGDEAQAPLSLLSLSPSLSCSCSPTRSTTCSTTTR